MADLGNLVSRLEVAIQKLEKIPLVTGSSNANDDSPLWLDNYNKLYNEKWATFLEDTINQGGDLSLQGVLLKEAFEAHSNLLCAAASHNRPDQKDLGTVLKNLTAGISKVQDFRETNRGSEQFNSLSVLSEGVPFLGWVDVSPKPANYVVQMEESATFYTNKVLKVFRKSEPKKADWAQSFIQLLRSFQQYIKENHGTGLQWNKNKPKCTASDLSSASGAPPPPPPPPPAAASSSEGGDEEAAAAALFSSINKGSDVTKGLKKVTKDMQTHKNPDLRQQGPVSSTANNLSPRPYGAPQYKKFAPSNAPKKEPVFELQNKKWVIEHQDGNQNLTIDDIANQHTIYMFNCKNSILTVKNKCNSIVLDNCKKSAIVFEDLIAGCEFVNCQDVKAQVNGTIPMISIDKVDGINIFLNKKSIATQIVTAKSSEINITVMDDDEIGEVPLPEQYVTLWDEKKKKFVTSVNELNL